MFWPVVFVFSPGVFVLIFSPDVFSSSRWRYFGASVGFASNTFTVLLWVFIFSTVMVHAILITTNVPDHQFDLGVKCQGHIYILTACNAVSFLTEVLHLWHNDCL